MATWWDISGIFREPGLPLYRFIARIHRRSLLKTRIVKCSRKDFSKNRLSQAYPRYSCRSRIGQSHRKRDGVQAHSLVGGYWEVWLRITCSWRSARRRTESKPRTKTQPLLEQSGQEYECISRRKPADNHPCRIATRPSRNGYCFRRWNSMLFYPSRSP